MATSANLDDAEEEGYIHRNLFRTDSESEEDEETSRREATPSDSKPSENSSEVIVKRQILHVVVEEQQTGGEIAHRLWPAAEYLANFILEIALQKEKDQDDSALTAVQTALNLSDTVDFLPILELGAGIGLTGLELATQLPTRVLLTDLDQGLPLLQRNTASNRDRYRFGPDAVEVLELTWGKKDDCDKALGWYRNLVPTEQTPLIILGSDVVYWEHLHEPLERTLCWLLSSAPPGSVCILAGMRRWKRDNSFYVSLGKRTRTSTHELRCVRLRETIERKNGERQIMRAFCVQWVERQRKSKA